MQLHDIKPTQRAKKAKRIGRGGKKGTYSGKGMKGQNSRAGARFEPAIRSFIKRYHKLRGANRGIAPGIRPRRNRPEQTVSLSVLSKNIADGETVTLQLLLEKNIIHRIKGKAPRTKILGGGVLEKKFVIEGPEVSKAAQKKIEAAGGTVK